MSANQIDITTNDNLLAKVNLLGMDLNMLRSFFSELGEKPYRAVQVLKWIHQLGVTDFGEMMNLSKQLRDKLQQIAVIAFPQVIEQKVSKDGTHKWLLAVSGGNIIETVFIPEKNRGTLCISSQVGCPINCTFCLTAKQGFNKNLTAAEIIGQVWVAVRLIRNINHPTVPVARVTNVVIMGMGEPLLNLHAVAIATAIMRDDNAYNLARRRVTVSTVGIVPGIDKLASVADVALAISLHAPNNELRDKLVPINKKYPIELLIAACKRHMSVSKINSITIEYVMLRDVNDKPEHARQLIKILTGLPCKVNLIPFNHFVSSVYTCSINENIYSFNAMLNKAGIITTVRTTRGHDINAACGQLVGKVFNKAKQAQNHAKKYLSLAGKQPMKEIAAINVVF